MRRAAIALIALASCAPPSSTSELAMREHATDVVLGRTATGPVITEPPPPPPPTAVNVPVLTRPAVPPERPAPTDEPAQQQACPQAHPTASIKIAATTTVRGPPVAATYPFRNDGTTHRGPIPRETTRAISNITTTFDGFSFDVVSTEDGVRTTTSFTVRPESAAPGAAGIFLVRTTTREPDGATTTLEPLPSLLVLPFPAQPGATWQASAVDPRTQQNISFDGRISGKARVDACGTPLDAWNVQLTEGRIQGPSTALTFAFTWAFATQYGGLVVSERVELSGRQGTQDVRTSNRAVISVEPKR